MNITDLIDQKRFINDAILKQMADDTEELIDLADAMAEAATNVQGQGYTSFIQARDNFVSSIKAKNQQYSLLQRSQS